MSTPATCRKVLIVASEFPPGPGGIGTHAACLAAGLQRLGWRVAVVASQDYASATEIAAYNASRPFAVTRFRRVPGAPVEALYRSVVLASRIRAHRPDVLIASGSRAVLLVGARFTGRGTPWVAIGHGTEFGLRPVWEGKLLTRAFDKASAVVCVSDYTLAQMNAAGIRPKAARVIPNGADPELFRALSPEEIRGIRADLGLPAGRLLVTVGNVTERKGQDVVVRALPQICREIPDVHYAIAGLPTRAEEIRLLAADRGVADRVHVLGRLASSQVVRLLNDSDLFVMTSRRTATGDVEGYGIAAVEAALCGKASVVSSDSGLQEAVRHGETGLVVAQNDSAAVASAVVRLLKNDEERRRLGHKARQRAETEQTWARRIGEYDEFLRQILGAHSDRVGAERLQAVL